MKQKINKTFNFEEAKKQHSLQKVEWLEKNYNKPITSEVFVREMKRLKKFSRCKRRKAHKYSPSKLRNNYKRLKQRYGFFK